MTGQRRHRHRWLGTRLLLAAVLGGCATLEIAPPRKENITAENARAFLRDNPCDAPGFVASSGEDRREVDSLAFLLTESSSLENEVHDCQRLVEEVGGERRFGALVGLFPIETTFDASRERYASGIRAVSIYNWGDWDLQDVPYTPLGIGPGWSCLFLMSTAGAADPWRGAVVPLSGRSCAETPTPTAWPLRGVEHRHVTATEYPHTARWGWDPESRQHYIGVPCLDRWCSIGTEAFRPMEPEVLSGPVEQSIPGWYDAQHLGVPQVRPGATGDTILRPGPWGVIVPTTFLMHPVDDKLPKGMAATIHVDATGDPEGLAHYERKFFLRVVGTRGSSHIEVRDPFIGGLSARYRHPPGLGDSKKAESLVVAKQVQHAAPGAVRWRWEDDDETAWISCWPDCCNPRRALF